MSTHRFTVYLQLKKLKLSPVIHSITSARCFEISTALNLTDTGKPRYDDTLTIAFASHTVDGPMGENMLSVCRSPCGKITIGKMILFAIHTFLEELSTISRSQAKRFRETCLNFL